ncbi:MAG: hypothetical protein ACLQUW_14350 [Desulfobaccales bacterium]
MALKNQPASRQQGSAATDSPEDRRLLMFIPIIHTLADLGSLGEAVRKTFINKYGVLTTRRKEAALKKLWEEIGGCILGLGLDFPRARLYQDGLPVCGREEEIVRDLASSGSHNHRLLVELMARGAALMGTESPELLLQEYDLAREAVAAAPNRPGSQGQPSAGATLLQARDRFIASRINATLSPGETALLFLGLLHAPEPHLDRDIQVAYPCRRLLPR